MIKMITLDNYLEYSYKLRPKYDDENQSHRHNNYIVDKKIMERISRSKYSLDEHICLINPCNTRSDDYFIISLDDLNTKFTALPLPRYSI